MIHPQPAQIRPLVHRQEMSPTGAFNRPISGGEFASVYLSRRSELLHRPVNWAEASTMRAVYLVDTSVHVSPYRIDLPTQEDTFSFIGEVLAHWQVEDPCEAVRTSLADADPVVRGHLVKTLRDLSRGFSIEDRANAEVAASRQLSVPTQLPQGLLLRECTVTLSLDADTKTILQGRKRHEWATQTRKREHDARTRDSQLLAIEQKMEMQLEANRADFELQRKQLEEEHRMHLEKLRMEHYSKALTDGPMALVALRLANRPEDVNEVIAMFMQQYKLDFEAARGMLNSLLENGLVNRSNVADIMARSTAVIADRLAQSPLGFGGDMPTLTGARRLPEPPELEDDDADDDL
ncbi:hypothetical protein [Lentzea sp. NPDC004782]|uniref:hypothetical protein n=1 Tax=Lentzea sp. NPDC004782 TaxID=3154458 RepID=UPI0033BA445D